MRPRSTATRLIALTLAVFGLSGAGWAAQDRAGQSLDADEPVEVRSLLGSYLAGRFARSQHETEAASEYYLQALARDPGNELLMDQAFLMALSDGSFDQAEALAVKIVEQQPANRMAQLFLGAADFKAGRYEAADKRILAASTGPIGELTGALARSWVKLAQGDVQAALDMTEVPKQAEWAQFYLRYHRGLAADVAGRRQEARAAYEKVFKQDQRSLRTTLAAARSASSAGDQKLARSIIREHLEKSSSDGHPLARALRDELNGSEKPGLLINSPAEGLSEVFYGLGEALTGEGGVGVGILYLQLSLYLQPEFPFALAALANAHEATKRYAAANAVYERIPKGSPLDSSIEIRKAFNLNAMDQVDEAKAVLDKLAAADPNDLRIYDALGNIMRARKRYAEAVDYYSKAIALIPKPDKKHWTYYYSRGTSYERTKRWSQAEADLQKALQLNADQPLVLNYLGYSWVDQNRNLKEGMKLIEKAVTLKPDDGYIVDSLGWAHYRQGNYKDAVRYLERAVELRPEDPVLNDHLGDALWRVGREREARFQWDQSLTLSPEPEDVEKIKKKLASGLQMKALVKVPKKTKEATRVDVPRKRVETKAVPTQPYFQ